MQQTLNEKARAGDVKGLRAALASVDQVEREAWLRATLLRAAYENQVEVVTAVLAVGAEPSATDELGHTPLHWAARRGHDDIARRLLEYRAEVAARTQDALTPIHLAAEHNFGAIVQTLLRRRADPTTVTFDKRTPLHMAADNGCAVATAVLLENSSTQMNEKGNTKELSLLNLSNDRGETPLARAAAKGHGAVCQLLLRARADPWQKNWWGQGALQLAAHGGHVGAAAVLLEGSADVNAVAQDASTPLHTAVEKCSAKVVELLLSHGGATEARSSGGRTPLHVAAERGCDEAVDSLLTYGATVDALTDEARTPLSCAASRGHVSCIIKLLDHSAEPGAMDAAGQTPLHAAVTGGKAEAADALLSRRARVDQPDGASRTPIMLAVAARQDAVIRVLLKRGACLPDDSEANTPSMGQLAREVEREKIQEQINQTADGKGKVELEAAEGQFEESRLKVLGLAGLTVAGYCAPAVHDLEIQVADATELAKVARIQENTLLGQLRENNNQLSKVQREAKSAQADLSLARKSHQNLKAASGKKSDQLVALRRDIAEVRASLKSGQQKLSALEDPVTQAEARQKTLEIQLEATTKDGENLASELQEAIETLAKYRDEKEKAAALHLEAHTLLNRH